MKKLNSPTTKYFNQFRALVITALVCSVILTTFILIESGTDNAITGAVTSAITSGIKDTFNISEIDQNLAPTAFSAKIDTSYVYHNTPTKISVSAMPTNANPNVKIKQVLDFHGNDFTKDVTLDENNCLTYHSLITRDGRVILQSTLDENVQFEMLVYFYGLNPEDERIESITPIISDGWQKYVQTTHSPLRVNKIYHIYFSATIKEAYLENFGLEGDNKQLPIVARYKLLVDGQTPNSDKIYTNRRLCFFENFQGNLQIRLLDGKGNFISEKTNDSHFDFNLNLNAQFDEGNTYIPTSITPYTTVDTGDIFLEKIDGVYTLTLGGARESASLSASTHGNNEFVHFEYADEHGEKLVNLTNQTIVRKANKGECDVYMVSTIQPEVKVKIHIVLNGNTPSKLDVTSKGPMMIANGNKLTASFDNGLNLFDESDVVWSVVDGDADILNGNVLYPNSLDKVTLRVQSVSYPELFDEVTFEVKLYSSFYFFVRKILGHVCMFALLGMGFGVCYFFFFKQRWLTFALTPLTLFGLGGFSEFLQSLTPDRSPRWLDVWIDFFGGMIGFAIAMAILALIFAIWKKAKQSSYPLFKQGVSQLNLKTLFAKTSALPTLITAEYKHEPTTESTSLEEVAADIVE